MVVPLHWIGENGYIKSEYMTHYCENTSWGIYLDRKEVRTFFKVHDENSQRIDRGFWIFSKHVLNGIVEPNYDESMAELDSFDDYDI